MRDLKSCGCNDRAGASPVRVTNMFDKKKPNKKEKKRLKPKVDRPVINTFRDDFPAHAWPEDDGRISGRR